MLQLRHLAAPAAAPVTILPVTTPAPVAPVNIRPETPADVDARESILDRCFGDARFTKTCERLREGRLPAAGLAFVAEREGRVVATLRLWDVSAGPGRRALMLGPLAVAPECQGLGIGGRLIRHALAAARAMGHGSVLLVGDAPYYARFGFTAEATGGLWLPGPYEQERFLALELAPGALAGARGLVGATGLLEPAPDLAALIAAAAAANDDARWRTAA